MDDALAAVAVAAIVEHMPTTDANGYPACLQEDWDCDDSRDWDEAAYLSHAEHVVEVIRRG